MMYRFSQNRAEKISRVEQKRVYKITKLHEKRLREGQVGLFLCGNICQYLHLT